MQLIDALIYHRARTMRRLLGIGVPAILLAEFSELNDIIGSIQYAHKEGNLAEIRYYYHNGWLGLLQDINREAFALWY